jgi:integrase
VGRHSKGIRPATARAVRAKFLAELAQGVNPVQRDKITVGQAVDDYLTWAESEKKYVAQHRFQYDLHLRHRLHQTPIAELTPGILSAIKGELVKTPRKKKGDADKPRKPLAPQTVNNILSLVRASINRAIGTGLWNGANPLSTKRGGPWQLLKFNNARLRFFTPDEAKSLLADLESRHPQLHDMVLLSLRTGLRATEIFKLKRQDVDAQADVLYIIAKGGKRTPVNIPSDMADMLRSYDRTPSEPIFKTPVTGKTFRQTPPCFNKAVQNLKLGPADGDSLYAVTFHTCRHTFASWLAQSGKVSLFELKNLMRHKNIKETMRYAHLFPGQESEKLSIIHSILA